MDTVDTDALDRTDMAQLVTGRDRALDDLMERHARPVFHFLYRMLASEEDAHDLAQETFVRVYRACQTYRPEQKFRTWLYTIAANLARNQLRWRARHPNRSLEIKSETNDRSLAETLPSNTPTPAQSLQQAERSEAVRAAVQRLPEDLREAIILCEWEDSSVAEAAAILHTTPKAVESRLYRARQLLRERLKQWL